MARVLDPIPLPEGVTVSVSGQDVTVKGTKGTMVHTMNSNVSINILDEKINFIPADNSRGTYALVGTTKALVNNLITGVSNGFEKKLELVGVGYRAQVKGNLLNLTLGFSHPVDFEIPESITIETPSATEVVVKGNDKQLIGQVAANIRAYRPPEPYKGKGVRYSGERIIRKETKKKK
jgi:large subunit ribosomal protein L6